MTQHKEDTIIRTVSEIIREFQQGRSRQSLKNYVGLRSAAPRSVMPGKVANQRFAKNTISSIGCQI